MRLIIALLAATRLTRFVTTDWLGEWLICQPLREWALVHEGSVDVKNPQTIELRTMAKAASRTVQVDHYPGIEVWRTKLVSGLDCPHCVGFWATLLTLALSSLPLPRPLGYLRDLTLKSLAGSYVVGHLSSYIDD